MDTTENGSVQSHSLLGDALLPVWPLRARIAGEVVDQNTQARSLLIVEDVVELLDEATSLEHAALDPDVDDYQTHDYHKASTISIGWKSKYLPAGIVSIE